MITISNNIRVPLDMVTDAQVQEIKQRLTFRNPAYGEALGRLKAMGRRGRPYGSDGRPLPEFITGWGQDRDNLVLPRGIMADLMRFLDIGPDEIQDNTSMLPPVDFQFLKELRPYQQHAMDVVLGRRFSSLVCPTGGGKTIMGLYAIAKRRQPTIIVVHTNKLVRQWAERIAGTRPQDIRPGKKAHTPALDVSMDEIGYIAEGKVNIGPRVTIALVQTLVKCATDVMHNFGQVILDECHHCPAYTFDKAIGKSDSYFSIGLSATMRRKDGRTPMIFWRLGPIVHEIDYGYLVREGHILLPRPVVKDTEFSTGLEAFMDHSGEELDDQTKASYQMIRHKERGRLIDELTTNHGRNSMIVNDIIGVLVSGGGPCLVLSDRTAHTELLTAMLVQKGIRAAFSHGKLPKKEQNAAEMALRHGDIDVLLGTGQLLGEGFDESAPSDLILATPLSDRSRLIQYLGRIGRPADEKAAVVHDYRDVNVPTLLSAATERMRAYKALAKMANAKGPTPVRREE